MTEMIPESAMAAISLASARLAAMTASVWGGNQLPPVGDPFRSPVCRLPLAIRGAAADEPQAQAGNVAVADVAGVTGAMPPRADDADPDFPVGGKDAPHGVNPFLETGNALETKPDTSVPGGVVEDQRRRHATTSPSQQLHEPLPGLAQADADDMQHPAEYGNTERGASFE